MLGKMVFAVESFVGRGVLAATFRTAIYFPFVVEGFHMRSERRLKVRSQAGSVQGYRFVDNCLRVRDGGAGLGMPGENREA